MVFFCITFFPKIIEIGVSKPTLFHQKYTFYVMIFERWKIFIGFSFQELWNKLVFAYNHKNIRSFFKSRPCKYLWVFNLGFGLAFLSHFTLNRCGFFSVGILCQFAPFFLTQTLFCMPKFHDLSQGFVVFLILKW